MQTPDALGIIAGSGVYPLLLADAARVAGVKKIIVAAFTDETSPTSPTAPTRSSGCVLVSSESS